ncbi:Ubiquitin-activating enzyme [Spathaspora sp. JA1]|nr:Ubiquitin-activating enzyme [Spathaspora sp. JA1]
MAKDSYLKKILGAENFTRIQSAKVLMVGAGGIGCELLKDLVLTGYGEIHIVDLDTITLSNLNRQFLFRQHDINKSKSLTVSNAVQHFNYLQSNLVSHHGNIMDTKEFPITWWEQFELVFNALDNVEARRYVNKMCLFLKKPLMESGTTGYEGQIQPIYPYYSECFDCSAKETVKTYPVCTIRSSPTQPVHCITWAKEFLFHSLFDDIESDQSMTDQNEIRKETDNEDEIAYLQRESVELDELRSLITTADAPTFIDKLLVRTFQTDIERLLRINSIGTRRESLRKPTPLDVSSYSSQLNDLLADVSNEAILNLDTNVWTVGENIYVLYKSAQVLQERVLSGREKSIAFDKDDEDTLNFVAAASNLRSSIFGIEMKSKFDIKEIAGNIIPAIATTNAIISGFSCLAGTKYFTIPSQGTNYRDISNISSTIFVSIKPDKYINTGALGPPNENCPSDSMVSRGVFKISPSDFTTLTLDWLIDGLEKYGYSREDMSIQNSSSNLLYDIDYDDNVDLPLSLVSGLKDGEIILISDDSDELESLELYINVGGNATTFPELVLRPKRKLESKDQKEQDHEENGIAEDNDGVLILDSEEENGDDDLIIDDEPTPKRRKIQ